MFRRLDDRLKHWVVNGFMCGAAVLLIIGFLSGLNEQKEAPSETRYKEKTVEIDNKKNSEIEVEDDFGDLGEIDPSPVNISEMPQAMDELYTKEDIQQSKEAAKRFVVAFHEFDGKTPEANVENSKPFITPELYETLKANVERPTAMTLKREVVHIEIIEPFAPSKEVLTWKAFVEGIATDSDQNQRKETDIYTVKLEKEQNTFKVTDFLINYLE